ncbi:cytochrome P450 [Granulicella tundricola MP5ACTX9]|uniref:Cytochrome P450 n=2 Tax=Granulicella TaxID=940557 RepID=E8X5Q4_GRATM|nr:cytochrome P450 [Granulicella tundricola MP5ACTX9]
MLRQFFSGGSLRRNAAEFMLQNAREYGDLNHYRIFGRNIYQLNHPDLIADYFLKDAPKHHRNMVMQSAREVLGHGLLTSEEPLHMRQRRLAQPAFLRERIAAYAEVIGNKTLELTARWKPGTITDLHPEMLELALRIVGKCLFDLDAFDDVTAIASAVDSFMSFMPLSFLPFARQIQRSPIPAMRRLERGKAHLDQLIYRMIAERRADPTDRGDLLSMLLNATEPEGDGSEASGMTDQQLHDECVTVILAGHETTANALSFALHLIAHDPAVQERLHEESTRVLGNRNPVAADYPWLPFATQVFAETMRLYPPVWVTGRTCAVPYTIAGYQIPVGATLLAPQYAVHRDPRFFADPERFDPSRFKPEKKAGLPRYAYFPFAGGSRQCIAEGLAWMEGTLVLAVIARDWRLTPPTGSAPRPAIKPAISLRPSHGTPLLIERRIPSYRGSD